VSIKTISKSGRHCVQKSEPQRLVAETTNRGV
jgi:hypothetical protein